MHAFLAAFLVFLTFFWAPQVPPGGGPHSPAVVSIHMVDQMANPDDYPLNVEKNGRIARMHREQASWRQVLFVDPIILGADIADARQSFDMSNRPSITFKLTEPAARKFGKATGENIGQMFAIVVDGLIISAPRIRSAITSGDGTIEGNFTVQEAEQMAQALRSAATR